MYCKTLIVLLAFAGSAFAQTSPPQMSSVAGKRPFTFEDMMKLKRIGGFTVSPDGKWVVFDCVDVDLEKNTKVAHLWIVAADGKGESRRLNQTPNHEERPRFSPDGKRLIWTSKATDPSQIWMCNFTPESGGLNGVPHQVTNLSTGGDGGIWTGDGKNVVFLSSVYPDVKTDAENKQRDEEIAKSKVKAKVFTKLLYRHWTGYTENKRSHLFVVPALSEAGMPESVPSRDLTPGDHDVPPFNLGGQDMYAVSHDGQELAYTSNIDEVEATSTNNEIFIVPIAGGIGQSGSDPKKISTSPGSDTTPVYSPDGKYLAWRSMARAGYEADKEALLVFERDNSQTRNQTPDWDRSVGSLAWSPDSKSVFFSAEDHGESPIYSLGLDGKQPTELARTHADDVTFANDGRTLFFSRVGVAAPAEIARLDVSRKSEPVAVTHVNDALLSQIDLQPLESFTFKGAENTDVQGFLIKPPGFEPNKKYPLKFLIHGGPQGAWGNSWSYRWNPELFAANGYVVVMINPHGSTGYGQKFTDGVNLDWGGKPYVDLMKGLDYAEKTFPFIDKTREAALGASYGGYMVNWILGHTDRFKCAVSHDGMFNTESAYGTTEELWFNEWEFGGPPWKNRELYRKWSPLLFADKMKTPTLVVHGQLDFRLDVSEGFQLFTTLQRMKVPSKMLYFPDEGHWVLKPQNAQLWYKTVNEWVDQWCAAK
ncbi:MAG: S9 family peptidase [Verrucomicrobiota bacterium]|nr:S9 family peptidase [Verrucomicrobiota bacterium]